MTADRFDRPFRVERRVHGYAVVVHVSGEVDASTASDLEHEVAIALALATPPAPVVIDLSGVRFFAAAGVNELHRKHLAARAAGVTLRVVARHRPVLRPLEITGLDRELSTCPTLADALRAPVPDRVRIFALPVGDVTRAS